MTSQGQPLTQHTKLLKEDAERMVVEVAASIQLTPSLNEQAEQNFTAIAEYIDAPSSQLANQVRGFHASGSFSIGAPIMGKIAEHQHDVDIVLELEGHYFADPQSVLTAVYNALLRPDSDGRTRYQGMVSMNSRCITVTYKDGRTVDIMPVHDMRQTDKRRVQLFHYKAAKSGQAAQSYHKKVCPRGFKDWYIRSEEKLTQLKTFYFREALNKSILQYEERSQNRVIAKADIEPFPEQKGFESKTPRTLALQLHKRQRDIAYRNTTFRKPPSVILATLCMKSSGVMQPYLIDELLAVTQSLRDVLNQCIQNNVGLTLTNPEWDEDLLTDRWGSVEDSRIYCRYLTAFQNDMEALKLEPREAERAKILKKYFGENVSKKALVELAKHRSELRKSGKTRVIPTGAIITTSASSGSSSQAKTTFYGGG